MALHLRADATYAVGQGRSRYLNIYNYMYIVTNARSPVPIWTTGFGEHGNVVHLMVGSAAAERVCSARGFSYMGLGVLLTRIRPLVSLPWASGYWGPNTSLLSFTGFRPLYHRPLSSGPQADVRPQEKKSARCCRFESRNDSKFIVETPSFIGPNSLSLDNYISLEQYVTSGMGFLIPSYIHFKH